MHAAKADSLVNETTFIGAVANIETQLIAMRSYINAELEPIKSDIEAMKGKLSHKADFDDVMYAYHSLTLVDGGVALFSLFLFVLVLLH